MNYDEQGNEQFGYRRGDVVAHLLAEPTPLFTATGYTLQTTLLITLTESATGFRRLLHLPSNETVIIECKEKCTNQTRITLYEKGIPVGNSINRGILEVTLHVYIPILFTTNEWNSLRVELGNSFSTVSTYLEYLAEGEAEWIGVEREEMYFSRECSVKGEICSFSLFNMVEYHL